MNGRSGLIYPSVAATAAVAATIAATIAAAVPPIPVSVSVAIPIAIAVSATVPATISTAARAGIADCAHRRVDIFKKSRQFDSNGSEHDHQKHGDEG